LKSEKQDKEEEGEYERGSLIIFRKENEMKKNV